jgi:putative ABC transport system ATP-binding protein
MHKLHMISVRNLLKTIETPTHRVEIIRDISFDVPAGQVIAITGPSGSGKSTLLGLLAGLDWPTSGTIHLDGTDITTLDEDQLALLRGKKIGFVFQAYQLIPTLNALENVLLPAELSANGDRHDKRIRRARQLLESVGLADRSDHYPAQLSGGEQQRVGIARAFMMEPSILLADEPTGNLDSRNGRHVMELMLELNRDQGTTLVLVTHDQALTSHADRRIVLHDGMIAQDEVL